MTDLPHLMEPQQVHFFLPCAVLTGQNSCLLSTSENNVLTSPLGLPTQQMLIPGLGLGPGACTPSISSLPGDNMCMQFPDHTWGSVGLGTHLPWGPSKAAPAQCPSTHGCKSNCQRRAIHREDFHGQAQEVRAPPHIAFPFAWLPLQASSHSSLAPKTGSWGVSEGCRSAAQEGPSRHINSLASAFFTLLVYGFLCVF